MKTSQILILHGWGHCSIHWQKVKEILEREKIEVFVPDLPGFGRRPPPKEVWKSANYAQWLESYCQEKNLENFFLLGHSFGGKVAVSFSAKNSPKISGLILCSPPLKIQPKLKVKFLSWLFSKFKFFSFLPFYLFLKKFLYKILMGKTKYINLSETMIDTFKTVVGEDLTYLLPKIQTKTLILWGTEDRIVPPELAFLINKKIKDSKLVFLPGIGHSPHKENPEKLAEKILEFLKE